MNLLQLIGGGKHRQVDIPVPARGTAIVDFGTGKCDTRVTVSQPSITASSVATAQVQVKASADHSADEHLVEELEVRAGTPVAGVGFTIFARTRNIELFGKYNVSWVWC